MIAKVLLRKNNDTDFMSELEAATHLQPAAPAVLMLGAVMALALIGLLWAAVSKVEVITRGQGQVVPTQEIQIVQSLEGGIIAEILVREGESVKKDQVLLKMSDVQYSAEERGTAAKFLSLQAQKARLEAEANGTEFVIPKEIEEKNPQIATNEKALYESRQKELNNAYAIIEDRIKKSTAELEEVKANIVRFTESKKLLQQELEITRRMVEQRASPKLEQLKQERELADLNGQIAAGNERQKGLQADLSEANKQKEKQESGFRSLALKELNEVETQIAGLKENLSAMSDRVDRRELRSPVDGVVNHIAVTTVGGVVEPAMKLVEIVPLDNDLKITARVSPDQIAFIRPGQDAKVKITAYDPQIYGRLTGKLTRVGASSVTDKEGNVSFEIEVHTDKNYLGSAENPLPVTPGMVAQVEVITGKRTILDYLLKPVVRARDVALTEH